MPYICLATNVDDGVVQILDLQPNSSKRNLSTGGVGQTKYVNRVQMESVVTNSSDVMLLDAFGLPAYFKDNVAAGGLSHATGVITVTAVPLAPFTVTIGGNATAPIAPGLDKTLTAAAIHAAIALVPAIVALADLTAFVPGAETVTLTAKAHGSLGNAITLVTSEAPGTIDLSGATFLGGSSAVFTDAQALTAATNLVARVDAGLPIALANINTVLSAVVALTELTSAGGSISTGSVAEVLQIIAGRGYKVPVGSVMETAGVLTSRKGSFTETVGSGVYLTTKELRQVRYTYNGGALNISDGEGYIHTFKNSVVLNPRGVAGQTLAGTPIYSYGYQGGKPNHPLVATPNTAPTSHRLVTVYNDDGTIF